MSNFLDKLLGRKPKEEQVFMEETQDAPTDPDAPKVPDKPYDQEAPPQPMGEPAKDEQYPPESQQEEMDSMEGNTPKDQL